MHHKWASLQQIKPVMHKVLAYSLRNQFTLRTLCLKAQNHTNMSSHIFCIYKQQKKKTSREREKDTGYEYCCLSLNIKDSGIHKHMSAWWWRNSKQMNGLFISPSADVLQIECEKLLGAVTGLTAIWSTAAVDKNWRCKPAHFMTGIKHPSSFGSDGSSRPGVLEITVFLLFFWCHLLPAIKTNSLFCSTCLTSELFIKTSFTAPLRPPLLACRIAPV